MRDRSDRRGRKEEVLSWFRNFFFFFLNSFLTYFCSMVSNPGTVFSGARSLIPIKHLRQSLSSFQKREQALCPLKKKKKENPTGAALSGDLRVGVKIGCVRADVILAVCDYKR